MWADAARNPLEVKLAETAPKRPLSVTIGAAIATLVVIGAILAGPALVTCASSVSGFNACFTGKLADLGILPRPAQVAIAETPAVTQAPASAAPAPVTSAPVATAPASVTPVPVAAPAASQPTTDVPATATAPSFGLLRAQPDGSTVIAGSGKPGTEIEIFSNGQTLGKTTVEPSGDWVFVPAAPLPPGGTELTLGVAGSTERSPQSFVVAIDPALKAEPLVVASEPGKASEVLQGLNAPTAPIQVATADPRPQPAAPPTMAVEPPPAAPVATPAIPAPQANSAAPSSAMPDPSTATAPARVPAPQVAAAEPQPAVPAVPSPEATLAPPSIDAIEIDSGRNFFAGAAAEGATVRLYVDDLFIAEAVVAGGRWLVETARNVLVKHEQLVRIDVLKPGSTDVASRAEVNFVVDVPETSPAAIAENTAPTTQAPLSPPTPGESTPTPQVAVAAPPAATPPTAPAAQAPAATPAVGDVPTMVAEPVGDPDDQRYASGKAIIRHGDNLWTIARRVYGLGIKYTAIYEANDDQIRDPDRIYPGQVFALPQSAD